MAQSAPNTVLVIDDEPSIREVLSAVLGLRGYATLVAEDGPSGLEVFRRHVNAILAVIVDIRMPLMNGGEVIAALREINPDVRIVAMTGYASGSTMVSGPRLAFLHKPMSGDEVQNALAHVLS